MRLIPVVVKKSRLQAIDHSYKYQGGVLNPNAVHGRGFYVRRIVGQSQEQVMEKLETIIITQAMRDKSQSMVIAGERVD